MMTRISVLTLALAIAALPALASAQTTTTDKAEKKVDKAESKVDKAQDKVRATAEKAGDKTKDAWLSAKTKIALAADDRVSAARVNVDTTNGAVTLRGKVSTAEEKKAAEEVAKSVEGVKSVRNTLQVVADTQRKAVNAKDEDITKAVKSRLDRDSKLKAAKIEVRADNGVVTLQGNVPDIGTSAKASELARGVPGVKSVKNELKEKT